MPPGRKASVVTAGIRNVVTSVQFERMLLEFWHHHFIACAALGGACSLPQHMNNPARMEKLNIAATAKRGRLA